MIAIQHRNIQGGPRLIHLTIGRVLITIWLRRQRIGGAINGHLVQITGVAKQTILWGLRHDPAKGATKADMSKVWKKGNWADTPKKRSLADV